MTTIELLQTLADHVRKEGGEVYSDLAHQPAEPIDDDNRIGPFPVDDRPEPEPWTPNEGHVSEALPSALAHCQAMSAYNAPYDR